MEQMGIMLGKMGKALPCSKKPHTGRQAADIPRLH